MSEARGTSEASKGDNFSEGRYQRVIHLATQWSIYLILCLSHSDKSCQSIKNCKASYCSPEGSKGAVQHDAINLVASKLSQRKIVATGGKTLPAIVTDMNDS